jgi:hypothetical protein
MLIHTIEYEEYEHYEYKTIKNNIYLDSYNNIIPFSNNISILYCNEEVLVKLDDRKKSKYFIEQLFYVKISNLKTSIIRRNNAN